MTYTVLITDPAKDELDAAYLWLVEQTPQHGPIWHNGLVDAILSLELNPARCPIVPNSEAAGEITRQFLYGNKQHAYRILFTIRADKVIVLHIIHAARDRASRIPLMPREFLQTLESEFQKTQSQIDRSLAQLSDAELHFQLNPLQNSPATILQHLAGNMRSRFTDFLTTDGEKPSRNREAEFTDHHLPRPQLLAELTSAWTLLFSTLAPLTDEDLPRIVLIRNEPHTVLQALLRQATHYAWHAAQIALIAKHLRQQSWQYLTIPPGGSNAFNQKMGLRQK